MIMYRRVLPQIEIGVAVQ